MTGQLAVESRTGRLHLVLGIVTSLPAGHWLKTVFPADALLQTPSGPACVLGPMRVLPSGHQTPRPFYPVEMTREWTQARRAEQLRLESERIQAEQIEARKARVAAESDPRQIAARLARENEDLRQRLARLEARLN